MQRLGSNQEHKLSTDGCFGYRENGHVIHQNTGIFSVWDMRRVGGVHIGLESTRSKAVQTWRAQDRPPEAYSAVAPIPGEAIPNGAVRALLQHKLGHASHELIEVD